MMPNGNDLTYFLEVCQLGNISRASERLGITQPSLTLAIKRLEETMGLPLLIRTKRGVYPNQAGKQLLIHVKKLIQDWENLKAKAQSSLSEVKGKILLGCHPSVGLYTLPLFLPQVLNENEELEISLKHDLSRKITEEIISLKLDLGIVVNPVRHPDLIIKKLCEDQVGFWYSHKKTMLTDYHNGSAVLIMDPDLVQSQTLLKKIKKKGIKYSRIVTSSSLENIANLVLSGAGIGILPSRVIKKEDKKKLKQIPSAPLFKDEISLIYRVENKGLESIKYLAQMIPKYIN
jgi:DNA-binding transcriptional LysR family regulator